MDFGGLVEILDASRTRLIEAKMRAGIPCGGWVSVASGWVKLSHRDGHSFNSGANTFFQIPETDADAARQIDHVVLYHGEIYAASGEGSGELRISSANGRTRLNRAAAIVSFSSADDETSVIALENPVVFENRFDRQAKVMVRPGETSALNYHAMRVVPTDPRAVAQASLKPRLSDLHVSDREADSALVVAKERQDRRFASSLLATPAASAEGHGDRLPAAEGVPQRRQITTIDEDVKQDDGRPTPEMVQRYARHATNASDAMLRNHLTRKMVAGQQVGEKILFPDKFYGRPQKVKLVVVEPLERQIRAKQKEEAAEKSKLIEELSLIRAE
jgi:hypothetical protein